MSGWIIAPLAPRDLPDVARVHALSFEEAWSPRMLRRILDMPGAFGLVAREPGEGIAGFAIGRVAEDECELLSLAVAPGRRRRGLGAELLRTSMARAVAASARRFFLEVAEDNLVAQRLYVGHGLSPVGRRKGYYELKSGGRVDALTMRCDLPPRRSAQPSSPRTSAIE